MHPLNSHAALIDIILFGLKADSFYVHLVFLLLLRATERDKKGNIIPCCAQMRDVLFLCCPLMSTAHEVKEMPKQSSTL